MILMLRVGKARNEGMDPCSSPCFLCRCSSFHFLFQSFVPNWPFNLLDPWACSDEGAPYQPTMHGGNLATPNTIHGLGSLWFRV